MSSSSETSLSEILATQIKAFLENFDYGDVEEKIKDLIPAEIREIIAQEKKNSSQLWLLFWFLCYEESKIPRFLELINHEYDWLVDGISNERKFPKPDTKLYGNEIKKLRSNNPKHTKYNVRRIELFEKLHDALEQVAPHKPVVLLGDLGSGKKWLALDVCQAYTIMKAMSFNIYWLDVGQCTSIEKDIEMLEQLSILLGDSTLDQRPCISLENRKSNLETNLEQKFKNSDKFGNCLLVLKNVQNVKTWKAFNLGCKTLLITRNKKVSDTLSPISHLVNMGRGFSRLEFKGLLEKYIGSNLKNFLSKADYIYDYSDAHPCLLNIIASDLKQDNSAWDRWIDELSLSTVADKKFQTVIETSLNALPSEELEPYAMFTIFPQQASIPANLLSALWNRESNSLIQKWSAISILTSMQSEEPSGPLVCVLPFIYSLYLKWCKFIKSRCELKALHEKVIDFYGVKELFTRRTEVHLCNNQHDLYFYNCIGHHLLKAGQSDLLSKLYLDFGFLEQKIRAVGLLNTIGDLKFYQNEIRNMEPRRRELLLDLFEFLPKVEDKLVQSKDACLLQYAFWETGSINEEAARQIKQYSDRVWFTEKGNFHQPRQIIELSKRPTSVTILEPDICLVVLSKSVILLDISLNYNKEPIFLIEHNDRNGKIIEVRLFHKNSCLLTLDEYGTLKLWLIAHKLRRRAVQRRSSKQRVSALNFKQPLHPQDTNCKQSIHESTLGKGCRIVAFDIEELPTREETRLHVAFENGDICVFEWAKENGKFEPFRVPTLHTTQKDIRFLSKILGKYYMLLNTANHINFWDLRDEHKTPFSFNWQKEADKKSGLICYEVLHGRGGTSIVFVFSKLVRCLTFKVKGVADLDGDVEIVYESADAITCAKLSRDGRYLVLGTKQGLVVFNMTSKSRMLHRNVSEAISCVDICELNDPVFNYIIICGTEHKKILNIYALRKENNGAVSWANKLFHKSNEDSNSPQLEPWVWLQGKNLFDISYNSGTYLVAADCRNRIHQICTTNTNHWNIVTPPEISSVITAITIYREQIFVGYKNGEIFNVATETTVNLDPEHPIYAVCYLQLMDEHILVASGNSGPHCKTCIYDSLRSIQKTVKFDTRKCYKVFGHYLLLINHYGRVAVFDCNMDYEPTLYRDYVEQVDVNCLGGCDFKNSRLFMATTGGNIYIYDAVIENNELNLSGPTVDGINIELDRAVSCLVVSNDSTLLAVGFVNGDIEVYRMLNKSSLSFLHKLVAHTRQVYDLRFSPCANVLVSCSEQLCFWSVPYMLNNPLVKNSPKRRSSRFSSQRSSDDSEEVDAHAVLSNRNFLQIHGSSAHDANGNHLHDSMTADRPATNYWEGKRGPADKPELLACLKFDGNQAKQIFANEQFTQLNTIDDEGVYYHFNLWEVPRESSPSQIIFSTPMITPTALDDVDDRKIGHDVVI